MPSPVTILAAPSFDAAIQTRRDRPCPDLQPEFRERQSHLAAVDAQFLRRGERKIRRRIEQPHELVILVIIHALQRQRPRAGNHHQREARINLLCLVIDPGEDLPDLIGRDEGAFLDRLARPFCLRLRRAVGRAFRLARAGRHTV